MQEAAQLVINVLVATGHYVLITLGFNLIFSTAKFIHMTHGSIAALGAYVAFAFVTQLGLPLIPAVLIAAVAAGFFGVLAELLVYQPLRKRKASSATLFVAGLGLFTIVEAALSLIFGSEFRVFPSVPTSLISYDALGGYITLTQILVIAFALAAWGLFYFLLLRTSFGKLVRAIQDDEEMARVVGIRTDRVMLWIFFIGSALAGFSGVLVGFDVGIYPMMGLLSALEGVIGSIIGGIGSLHGGVIGSAILGFVEQVGTWLAGGEWKSAMVMLLLIAFLIFRPRGFFRV